MKITTFTYTKPSDQKVSKRVLAVSAEPTKLYGGTDITSLSDEDQVVYAMAVDEAKNAYLNKIKEINDLFDLNFNFRQFTPEHMSEVVHEFI